MYLNPFYLYNTQNYFRLNCMCFLWQDSSCCVFWQVNIKIVKKDRKTSDISDYFRSKILMLFTFDFARSNESIIKVAHNLHIKGLLSIYWERCSLFYLTNTLVLVFFISFSNSMHLWFKGLTEFTFWNCDWKEEFIISKRYWTKCRLNLFNAAACWFFSYYQNLMSSHGSRHFFKFPN